MLDSFFAQRIFKIVKDLRNAKVLPIASDSKYLTVLHYVNLCNTAAIWNMNPAEFVGG